MDQLICGSLSQTHYLYEVAMLKVRVDVQNIGEALNARNEKLQ